MARIGLTLDEYIDLRLTPPGCAGRTARTAEYMRGQFPMTTSAASGHLRSRGYDCRPVMLEALVEQGVVSPKPEAWTQAECRKRDRFASSYRVEETNLSRFRFARKGHQ